jgi:hypothetical protein
MRLVELFELQIEEGPCFDAYAGPRAVRCDSRDEAERRWPRFAPNAFDGGFLAVSAVPMRLRTDVVGALNLFSSAPKCLTDNELRIAQGMADIATIGILQERVIRDGRTLTSQLQGALDSRIVIEQAKGVIAEHNKITVDDAFALLRRFARNHNWLLSEAAGQVVNGTLRPETLATRPGST